MRLLIVIIFLLTALTLSSQEYAIDILKKSIEYHDPENKLAGMRATLQILESRPNGEKRNSIAVLDPKSEYYLIQRESEGRRFSMISDRGTSSFYLDGSADYSNEEAVKFRLNEDRMKVMSSYYRYLWHLPMTLNDPGTIIHSEVQSKDFFGKACLEIKVTYEPEIGDDTWYFYFDPNQYSLEGYRFYHDESANDGEYIILSGIHTESGLKIPKIRKWYTHKEGKFLGSDELIELKIK